MVRRLVLFIIAFLAAPAALAQGLEIIPLRNRPAEQIIPVVRPMLDRDGAISGSGFQLMVRTSPQNLAQIRQMVESLDRAARQLIIEVRGDREASSERVDARGRVVISPGASGAAGSVSDSRSQSADTVVQQVRTQEGSPAFISRGTSQLVPQRTVRRTVNGVVVEETSVERDISSGFYATPRVSGDTVFLDISTQRAAPNAGVGRGGADVSRLSSTVSGRLGEWIEIGGISQSGTTGASGILSSSSGSTSAGERIYLRVIEAR
jgi:type II secretory pathway component GspD/PulD (secretin)